MLNQVFISYRHETPEHARAVKRLAELLRQANIPVQFDQFYLDDHPGGPNEGWPKWSRASVADSCCVLVIASLGWFEAYEGKGQPGIGCGAASEAAVIDQHLYDHKHVNDRFRLAFLSDLSADSVPVVLRPWEQFRPFSEDAQLNQLVAWIAQRLGRVDIKTPSVQWPEPDEDFTPDFADRVQHEWQAIKNMLAGRFRERILLFEAGSGLGKSVLLRQAAAYARSRRIAVARVDFKSTKNVPGILRQIHLDIGPQLPNFAGRHALQTHLLRKDLRALRRPVLLIFDSYDQDAADNKLVADWLSLQILNEVETALGVAVIVAGQRTPDYARAGWRDLARHVALAPITEPRDWEPWIHRRYPRFREKNADLRTVLLFSGGNPAVVSAACEAIARS